MYKKIFTVIFLLVHICLFNINAAEWGDSYRILRASEFVRNFSYPSDEKRPPLFSMVLALRPDFIDPITFGHFFMFLTSLALFFVFMKLCDALDERARKLAYVLFIFNPVLLYWSIRIYADTFFALIVVTTAYLYFKWRLDLTWQRLAVLGVLCGLGVLTRFEGYILTMAVLLGIVFIAWPKFTIHTAVDSIKDIGHTVMGRLKYAVVYTAACALVLVPYFILRNPFNSKYFDEPSGRSYDMDMLAVFLLSTLFVLGVSNAALFAGGLKKLFITPFLAFFILVELLLILMWPAAIPRLFVPILPFLIIGIARGISLYFDTKAPRVFLYALGSFVLLGVFVLGQFHYKLQFLVPVKYLFLIVVFLQVVLLAAMYFKKYSVYLAVLTASTIVWSLSVIYVHKDLYSVVKDASVYIKENISGYVGYNDVSSVSDWYINTYGKPGLSGSYYNYTKKADLEFENLRSLNYDYLSLTNEHNTDTTLDIESRPYLMQIKEFKRELNGKLFWTKLIKVNKEYGQETN